MFTNKIKLKPATPFNFDLTTQIFSDGDAQIRAYKNGKFTQLIRLNDKLALLNLTSVGTVDKPELKAEFTTTNQMTTADNKKAREIINWLFNLNQNLTPFYETTKQDPTMQRLTQKLRGLQSPTTQTVYEALVDSIVEQQISLKVANTLERRIIKKFGESLTIKSVTYYIYPKPETLYKVTTEELRSCGLSQRKAEYIKETSTLIAEGKLDLEKFKTYADIDEVIRELDAVRGIGIWTAELTMLRAMQKWEALPADDVGLRRIISLYYCNGRKITSADARRIAEPWGKWKGLAAYFLVVADMLGLEP